VIVGGTKVVVVGVVGGAGGRVAVLPRVAVVVVGVVVVDVVVVAVLVAGVVDRESPRVSIPSPQPVTRSVAASNAKTRMPVLRPASLVESMCPPHR
jgi:hypothetical protein